MTWKAITTKMNLPILGADVVITGRCIRRVSGKENHTGFPLTLRYAVGQVVGQTASNALDGLLQVVEVLLVVPALDILLDGLDSSLNVFEASAQRRDGITGRGRHAANDLVVPLVQDLGEFIKLAKDVCDLVGHALKAVVQVSELLGLVVDCAGVGVGKGRGRLGELVESLKAGTLDWLLACD